MIFNKNAGAASADKIGGKAYNLLHMSGLAQINIVQTNQSPDNRQMKHDSTHDDLEQRSIVFRLEILDMVPISLHLPQRYCNSRVEQTT